MTLTPFSSRVRPCSCEANNSYCVCERFKPCSCEANNSYYVCERFKSLTKSLSPCCIKRWVDDISGKRSWSSFTILVVAPCPLSEKLSLPSSSMVQSLVSFGMGKQSRGTVHVAKGVFGYWIPCLVFTENPFTSNRNHILWCDMVAHAIQSVLQRALMVMNPVATFLSYLLMYHNACEGPKAGLGPQHCSQSVIHRPF